MEILLADLILEILLLLPIATLLRFRCVSKKWRNIIDSPHFVKSHLDHPNKAHYIFLVLGQPNAYQIVLDSFCNSTAPHTFLKELTPNTCRGRENYGVAGPCNGLLCTKTDGGVFCVWNPSTEKHFHLPQLPVQQLHVEFLACCWGLGYDCNSDDYKVVCIPRPRYVSATFVVWVYSLKSGSWKRIGDFFPYFFDGLAERGVFLNGALHWVLQHRSLPVHFKKIVAFDLGKSECNLVAQPESMQNPMVQYKMQLRVGVLDGCLYGIYEDKRSGTYAFELWVMKEYGVKESWTRLIRCKFSRPTSVTPLTYTEAGDLLLWISTLLPSGDYSRGIMHYEFETRSFNRIEEPFNEEFNRSLPKFPCAFVYIPSLVCPQNAGNSSVAS